MVDCLNQIWLRERKHQCLVVAGLMWVVMKFASFQMNVFTLTAPNWAEFHVLEKRAFDTYVRFLDRKPSVIDGVRRNLTGCTFRARFKVGNS